jgi:mannose/fructose/N-acetylgalactosamine-specific phosphotransferase system component IIB
VPGNPSFLLIRVDDRLLHGQVALAWGGRLKPKTYLIVDERLAGRPLEAQVYRVAAPESSRLEVLSPEAFLRELERGSTWEAAVLLFRDIESLAALVQGGFRPEAVNLGGIHHHAGAREVLPYLFLSAADWDLLEEMSGEGVGFFAQDLPDVYSYSWDWLRRRRPADG